MAYSKHYGNNFETKIKNINTGYLHQYIAEIYKENDSRNYKEKLRVDFTGWTLCYEGILFNVPVPIGIECKSVGINKFKKQNIKTHQFDYLKRLALAGGIALILIEFRKKYKIIKINITQKDIIKNTNFVKLYNKKKSYTFEELSEVGTVIDIVKGIDYLGVGDINKISFFKKNGVR